MDSWIVNPIAIDVAPTYMAPRPNSFQSMMPAATAAAAPSAITIVPAAARLATSRQNASDLAHSAGQNLRFAVVVTSALIR